MEIKNIPLVSVLLPVYNCEQFIEEAVASLIAQSYRNLEVIVVDDGSTDSTSAILDTLAKQDARIRVIRTKNRGLVAALNTSIEAAGGELVARLDGDDIAEPQRIERQVIHMAEFKDCVAVGSNTTLIDVMGRPTPVQPSERTAITLPDRCKKFQRFPPAPPSLPHPSVMIRTGALRKVGGYRSYFKSGAEDRDLWWRLSRIGTFHCLKERLIRYRIHPKSRTNALNEKAIGDALVCDLSAVCRFHGLDDTDVLEVYGSKQDLPEAIAAYDELAGDRYPVWALHAYRVLRRRCWKLSGSQSRCSFRAQTLRRALASLSSRSTWYVLSAMLK